jgi:hypothetical protein
MKCYPLLKFDSDGEKPHLQEDGLAALSAVPPPIRVVTLVGDGRCGKSTLASKLIGDEAAVFPVGDTGESVTVGIDLCIMPKEGSEGTLVVLDCEGGNNPAAAIRDAVDVVATLVSTLVVQVVWGQMSEGQLMQIGQALANRDRLLRGATAKLHAQDLMFVVNGCHLNYAPDHLNQTFLEVHAGASSARNELRAQIKKAYSKISFITIPSFHSAACGTKIESWRRDVNDCCAPLSLVGSRLSGAQAVEMLRAAVHELRDQGAVPIPSVFRRVIYDNFLMPMVATSYAEYESSLPDFADGEYRPLLLDTRSELMRAFDKETQNFSHNQFSNEFIIEARKKLEELVEVAWTRAIAQNMAIGEQDRDVSTESEVRYSHTEERVVGSKRTCWIVGKEKKVVEPATVFKLWTRTRVLKKNGQTAYSEWAPSSHTMDSGSMSSSFRSSSQMSTNSGGMAPTLNSTCSVGERFCTPPSSLMSTPERKRSVETPPRSPLARMGWVLSKSVD